MYDVWRFAGTDDSREPDVVLACAGDVPTTETVAAAWLLRKHVPDLKVRLVNVVDISTLMRADVHPHGMDDISFESYSPKGISVIFVHHGPRCGSTLGSTNPPGGVHQWVDSQAKGGTGSAIEG